MLSWHGLLFYCGLYAAAIAHTIATLVSVVARVYFAVGEQEHNDERNMVTDLQKFSARMRARHATGLTFKSDVLNDENHDSLFPRALSNGLRYVFDGK